MNNNSSEFTRKSNSIYERFKETVRQSETVSSSVYAGMAVVLPILGASMLGQGLVGGQASEAVVSLIKMGSVAGAGVSALTYSAIAAAKWAINANDTLKEQESAIGRSGATRWTRAEIEKYAPELLSETDRNYSKEKLKQFAEFQGTVFTKEGSPFRHEINSALETAAQKEAGSAQAELARRYLMELNTVQYAEKAVELFRAGVESGNADCCLWLGKMHLEGFGVDQDIEKGWAMLTVASQKGSAGAAYTLGVAHQKGEMGAAKDYIEAERYFERAAELGSAKALADLPLLRNVMTALSVDSRNLHTLKESAIAGNPQAHFELGRMYYKGTQVEADPAAALLHLEQAAEMDHAESMSMLGQMYVGGFGVDAQNLERGIKYLERAAGANCDSVSALHKLADLHGTGVAPNSKIEKALAYLDTALFIGGEDGGGCLDLERERRILDKHVPGAITDGQLSSLNGEHSDGSVFESAFESFYESKGYNKQDTNLSATAEQGNSREAARFPSL